MQTNFKKGDKVIFEPEFNHKNFKKGFIYKGVVTNVSEKPNSVKENYPVMVQFDDKLIGLFTSDGRYSLIGEVTLKLQRMQYLESIFKEGDIVIFEKQINATEVKEVEGRVVSVLTGEIPKGQPKNIYTYPVLVKLGSYRGHRTFTHDGRLIADGVINLRLKFPREEKQVHKITMYKPFEVGDEVVRSINVFGYEHTKGQVISIGTIVSDTHIIGVRFEDSPHTYYYDVNGSYCKNQKQTLFHIDDFEIISDKSLEKNKIYRETDKILSLQPALERGFDNLVNFTNLSEVVSKHWLEKLVDSNKTITTNSNKLDYYPKKEYPMPNLIGNITSVSDNGKVIFKSTDNGIEKQDVAFEKEAYKDDNGKLFHEIDFMFIKDISERMASNKSNGKYEPFNWKRPMSQEGIEKILQAGWRHMLELMDGNYEDDGRPFGHLEGVVSNLMIANYHLRKRNESYIRVLENTEKCDSNICCGDNSCKI